MFHWTCKVICGGGAQGHGQHVLKPLRQHGKKLSKCSCTLTTLFQCHDVLWKSRAKQASLVFRSWIFVVICPCTSTIFLRTWLPTAMLIVGTWSFQTGTWKRKVSLTCRAWSVIRTIFVIIITARVPFLVHLHSFHKDTMESFMYALELMLYYSPRNHFFLECLVTQSNTGSSERRMGRWWRMLFVDGCQLEVRKCFTSETF